MPAPKDPIKYAEWKRKIGENSWMKKGLYIPSVAHRQNLSKANKGQIPWIKGKHQTTQHVKRRVESRIKNGTTPKITAPRGEKHYLWIKDRTLVQEKHRLRGTIEWRNWRRAVFERDRYTCQECKKVGGYLEPNHIVPIRLEMRNIFNIDNGITLCRPCHQKTIWKEEQFIEKYSRLIANTV